MESNMKLGIMGRGRSGKDEAADLFIKCFGLKYGGSTSVIISKEVAKRENLSFEEAHAQRHIRRQYWYDLGNEMRKDDPAALVRAVMQNSDMIVGVRDGEEMQTLKEENLCDLIVWVDRPSAPFDPTLKFDSSYCDIVIQNHWGLNEYHSRLFRLGLSLGLTPIQKPIFQKD
jgi:hypothetical protein